MTRSRGRDDGATDFDAYADEYAATVQRSIDFSGLDHDFFTRRKVEHLLDLRVAGWASRQHCASSTSVAG